MPGPFLVPILGDQLSPTLASLRECDPAETVILMMEVWEEATYVRHHKQKIALIFSAMRHFAQELRAAGWQVDYTTLDDPENAGSFTGEVARAVERHGPSEIRVVEPGEWRVRQDMDAVGATSFPAPSTILPDDRFIASNAEFADWAEAQEPAPHGVLLPRDAAQDRAADGGRMASPRAGSGITMPRTASR